LASPYFDYGAFMHHALHVLDALSVTEVQEDLAERRGWEEWAESGSHIESQGLSNQELIFD